MEPSGADNICDFSATPLILHYRFTSIAGTLQDRTSRGITGYFGSSQAMFYPTGYDANDAWPIKARGHYFTGASEFHIPPYASSTDPSTVLAPSFTVETWARSFMPVPDIRIIFGKFTANANNFILFGTNNDAMRLLLTGINSLKSYNTTS